MPKKQNCIVSFLNIIESIIPDKNGCLNWPMGISRTGYGVYSINNFTYSVPRLIFNTLKDGMYDDGLILRHKCDNRACCNIDHLEIGTQSENLMDASRRRRLRFGENNNKTFLKKEQIIEIRRLYPEKSTVELGKIYGMAPSNIRDIIIGKTWGHIEGAKKLLTKNSAKGVKQHKCKLTEAQVLEIRQKHAKTSKAQLSREYGVSFANVRAIVNGKIWVHL